MQIKKIVKVMNFQTLLRINKAMKKADQYKNVGKEITDILSSIVYNKNLMLDKKLLTPDPSKPKLNIYIANDYGFCGDFNASVRHQIRDDADAYKIIIGKKILYNDDKTILKISKEDFYTRFKDIEDKIDESLKELSYSEINLYYNHYYSYTQFGFLKLQLFPVEFKGEIYEGNDFVYETDITSMLKSLLSFYVCYQIKMAESISVASENVVRNQITNMALDKIETREVEERNIERKEKLNTTILKNVENYKRIMEGEN